VSLVGNLEDLSLPDILQIVSLSKKSGILTIEQEGRQGQIYIREGRVIQTVSPRSGKTLGEILTSQGLIKPDDLKKALEEQQAGGKKELLGAILIRMGLIAQNALEKVVQKQIEESIVYFLTWREGTFSFELCDIEGRGEVSIDPHAFILEQGIDTQWLVLEGTRLMDERKKSGTLFEDHDEPGAGAEASEGEAAAPLSIVLVDDDAVFREQFRERFERLGYQVTACETAAEALEAIKKASSSSVPAVITDIVYPTTDGTGFLGGLELVERIRADHPAAAVMAITAYPDDNVKGKLGHLGVGDFFIKPSGSGDSEKEFYDLLAQKLAGIQGAAQPPAPAQGDLAEEIGEEPLVDAIAESGPEEEILDEPLAAPGLGKDEMSLLQDMIQELQDPKAASEIGLLILRFAAEILNRAVLFVIKGGQAVGLGGFGIDVSAGGKKGGVKSIAIPLEEESVFEEAVRSKVPFRGPVVHTPQNVSLMKDLGGETPGEAVVIPLVAGGKVRVVLYGDNLPDEGALPSTQALEIFLVQAGQTLERVLLEKKLQQGGAA
jgi:CheY-like chemotaxis protein